MPPDRRKELLYLADILDSAATVARWMDERGDRWDDDDVLRNAVVRQLSVVGEAASCLTEEMRVRLGDIPWRQIRGFRNIAIHAYFRLDWGVVREIATVNLPGMVPNVLAVLRAEGPDIAARFDTDGGEDEAAAGETAAQAGTAEDQ